MSMKERGHVPLNANDHRLLYKSKRPSLRVNLHHYKNHNIFDLPQRDSAEDSASSPYAGPSYDKREQDQTAGTLPTENSPLKRSPTKRFSKIGALYNPNNHDPRRVLVEPGLDKPAGMATNFGMNPPSHQFQPSSATPIQNRKPESPEGGHEAAAAAYNSGAKLRASRSGLGLAGLNSLSGKKEIP